MAATATMAELRDALPLRQPRPPDLSNLLVPSPGQVIALTGPAGLGLTRLGLVMLAAAAPGRTVACVDVRGWLCPAAAWESGIDPSHLVVVRCDDPVTWARVVSGLLDGMAAVYAEVPFRLKEGLLHKLAASARRGRTPLLLRPVRGGLPSGLAHLDLEGREVTWEGAGAGHGRLLRRRVALEASGKAMRGMTRIIEVEDDGANTLRVVPGLGVAPAGRAIG